MFLKMSENYKSRVILKRFSSFEAIVIFLSKSQFLNKFQISGSHCTARSADLFIASTLVAILQA